MSAPEIATNNLMILGGGLIQPAEGAPLELRTTSRVDRAGQYFQDHRDRFLTQDAMILCSGGRSPIYDDLDEVPSDISEASLGADRLMRGWGVPANIIWTEGISTTTTMNFVESVEMGLAPAFYGPEYQLGVVTHPHHYWRAKDDIRDVGFSPKATFNICPTGKDSAVRDSFAKEAVARGVRYAFFRGVRRGDLADLRVRNKQLETALRGGFGGVVKGIATAIQNR